MIQDPKNPGNREITDFKHMKEDRDAADKQKPSTVVGSDLCLVFVLDCLGLSCCVVLWCVVLSCVVLPCLALSCLVLSCLVLSWQT